MMTILNPPGTGKLTKTSEYRRVYKNGKLARGEVLWVYLLPTAEGKIRTGISVGRNIIKKATERNRLKRMIRGWFWQNARNAARRDCDVVVVVKKAVVTSKTGSKKIRQELSGLLKQVAS